MTPDQVHLVEVSFSKVKPISEQASGLFYDRLFEIKPELRPLFKGSIKEQGRLLMVTIATAVALLRRPNQLEHAVEDLGARHANYGVRIDHFEPVGEALIWALEKGLGPEFTTEVKAAWVAMYRVVTITMIKGLSRGESESKSALQLPIQRGGPSGAPSGWFGRLRRWMGLFAQ